MQGAFNVKDFKMLLDKQVYEGLSISFVLSRMCGVAMQGAPFNNKDFKVLRAPAHDAVHCPLRRGHQLCSE